MRAVTKEQKRRYRAIRKAVQTRRLTRLQREQWEKVDKPALENWVALHNHFIANIPVRVRLSAYAHDRDFTVKGNVQFGDLIAIKHWGRTVSVRPDGYTHPHDYYFAFWEPLLPEIQYA